MRTFGASRRGAALLASAAALAVSAVCAVAVMSPGGARAVTGPPVYAIPARPVVAPAIDCAAIPSRFAQVDEAPASIASAAVVGSGDGRYCDVKGWIAPQTQFEVRLPTTTYQGRYLQLGCGGNCGSVGFSIDAGDSAALSGNTFAVAADNEGHTSTGGLDVWAAGGERNPLRSQFGYLADHLTAVVAKALIATYYGQAPAYSYFVGYSDGGRAAIQEAQRYPRDFDGISAGAPAVTITYSMESFLWAAQHLLDAAGDQILDASAITTLHDAAVAACDPTDGLRDGQVSDPRLCHWDPGAVECSATTASHCLTPAQVAAARAMYAGPRTADGRYLWPGGEARGSEPAWPSFAQAGVSLGGSFTKYMLFPRDRPASYTWRDFRFDERTWREMADMARVYNANDFNHPDLSAFARAGGRLMVWESWGDEAAGPYSTLDWYAQVQDAAGGLNATQRFARVFKLPGGSHGQTAAGVPYSVQIVPSLVAWTEQRRPPAKLDAVARDAGGNVTRTYPVFAYPARARYTGSGDVDDEANWVAATPFPPPDDHFDWLGDPRGRRHR